MRFAPQSAVAVAMASGLVSAAAIEQRTGLGLDLSGLGLTKPISASVNIDNDLSGKVLAAGVLADPAAAVAVGSVAVGAAAHEHLEISVICNDCYTHGQIDAEVSLQHLVPSLSLTLKNIEAKLDLDIAISDATTVAVNLVAAPVVELPFLGLDLAASIYLDLVLGVSTAIDLSAGVEIELVDEAVISTDILSGKILEASFSGLSVAVLPIKVRIGCTEVHATLRLRVELDAAVKVDAGEVLPILDIVPSIGAGLELAVYVNLVEYIGLFCPDDSCPKPYDSYGLNVGAIVGLNVDVENLAHIHLAPTVSTALLEAPLQTHCATTVPRPSLSMTGSGSVTGTAVATPSGSVPAVPVVTGSGSIPGVPVVTGSGSIPGVPVVTGSGSVPVGPILTGSGSIPGGPVVTGSGSIPGVPVVTGSGSIPGVPVVTGPGSIPGGPILTGSGSIPGGPIVTGSGSVPAGSVTGTATGSVTGPVTDVPTASVTAPPGYITSTVTQTATYTITACAANVANCPGGYQGETTLVHTTVYTTICPATATITDMHPKPTTSTEESTTSATVSHVTAVPCSSVNTFQPPTHVAYPTSSFPVVASTTEAASTYPVVTYPAAVSSTKPAVDYPAKEASTVPAVTYPVEQPYPTGPAHSEVSSAPSTPAAYPTAPYYPSMPVPPVHQNGTTLTTAWSPSTINTYPAGPTGGGVHSTASAPVPTYPVETHIPVAGASKQVASGVVVAVAGIFFALF